MRRRYHQPNRLENHTIHCLLQQCCSTTAAPLVLPLLPLRHRQQPPPPFLAFVSLSLPCLLLGASQRVSLSAPPIIIVAVVVSSSPDPTRLDSFPRLCILFCCGPRATAVTSTTTLPITNFVLFCVFRLPIKERPIH